MDSTMSGSVVKVEQCAADKTIKDNVLDLWSGPGLSACNRSQHPLCIIDMVSVPSCHSIVVDDVSGPPGFAEHSH